ncbi:MAG: sugar ABC transporter permease, partial [Candidatus Omnitrophica bacterium]|nr:sugar ABC transporter permease [Candidatus Omnitrophota bacterium]
MTLRKLNRYFFKKKSSLLLLIVPLIVYLFVFFLYPLTYEVYISFFNYSLGSPTKSFVGFGNYVYMFFKDIQFFVSVKNTFIFITLAMLIELVLGFAIALALNKESKSMGLLRSLIIIPTSLTPMAVGMAWKTLYNPDMGAIPYYLNCLGGTNSAPTLNPSTALFALVIVEIWQWTPIVVLLVLAALKSLPLEIYEAGRVDGASIWQSFKYITIPLMRPIIILIAMLRVIDGMKAFDTIWAITGGGPGTATTVMNLRVYDVGIQQLRIGYAAAISNVISLIGLILGGVLIYILYSK